MTPMATLRAFEVLKRLPQRNVSGVEVGVWRGFMSSALLCYPTVCLYMVDNWVGDDRYASEGYGSKDSQKNKEMAYKNTEYAAHRREIMPFSSETASKYFKDGSVEFVFIDADHSYDGVKSDIAIWLPKIRQGGLLGGHDYDNPNYPFGAEVKRAVDEAVSAHGWALDLGHNTTWFVRI